MKSLFGLYVFYLYGFLKKAKLLGASGDFFSVSAQTSDQGHAVEHFVRRYGTGR